MSEMIRIAILDMYEGQANQGMRCIRQIIHQWGVENGLMVHCDEFDVRQKCEIPDLSYDIYISTGGPGSPLESEGSEWEEVYFKWLDGLEKWNGDENNLNKKFVFLICHSFQIVCRHYGLAEVSKRRSTSFGVFPVHVLLEGQSDPLFKGLGDPFYVVDSRDYQAIRPDFDKLQQLGSKVLCIEKYRPHVPLDQAIMGIRINEHIVATQFHPEADAIGMSMYLQSEEKKKIVIEQHGEEKWKSMIEQLGDPDKIMKTYSLVLPNFLNEAVRQLHPVTA